MGGRLEQWVLLSSEAAVWRLQTGWQGVGVQVGGLHVEGCCGGTPLQPPLSSGPGRAARSPEKLRFREGTCRRPRHTRHWNGGPQTPPPSHEAAYAMGVGVI